MGSPELTRELPAAHRVPPHRNLLRNAAADSTATPATSEPTEHSADLDADATVCQASTVAESTARPRTAGDKRGRLMWRYTLRGFSVTIGLILWQVLSARGVHFILNFQNIPTPSAVWTVLERIARTQAFYVDLGVSLRRIGIAYALASLVGVTVGVLIGRFRLANDLIAPHLELLRPIPAVAWVPLAIIMLPTQESSIVFITALGTFFPVVTNTVIGVGQTPKALLQAARSLGASHSATLWHVVLPSAMPAISAGLITGMGIAWFSLLAGEMISGQYGIGYYTWNAYSLVQYPQIVAGMICIGALGTLSTHALRLATRHFLRWQGDKVGAAS
jgi:NitT/TauT family transport system permease protein